MIRFQPFVANVATCGGVGTGWVWNVKVYVADGVSTQTFTVAVNGTTVATLTGSESYGPFRVVGPDTLTVTANSASDTQVVTLDGNVVYTNPPDITDPEQGLVAPLTLPAEPGKPLITQGGNTLDDGSDHATLMAQYIALPAASLGPLAKQMSWSYDTVQVNIWDGIGGRGLRFYDSVNGVVRLMLNGAGKLTLSGSVQPNNAGSINSGTGAPTIAGTAGDFYFRTDTPTTADQRIYICTVTGAAGAATWVGIV